MAENDQCICIYCGHKVHNLFKEYSATVVKLTNCKSCHNIADKYVEYDIVILIIDMILLQKEAYRHILFNLKLKNLWKLSFILLLMETYSEWTLTSRSLKSYPEDNATETMNKLEFEVADFHFYNICLQVVLKTLCFLMVLHLLTVAYCKITRKCSVRFAMIWRTLTVSSFGIFLLLPTLIWDVTSVQEMHLTVVSLYTVWSQLLAYSVLCGCPKIWSIMAIFLAYYCKSFLLDVLEIGFFVVKHQLA